MKINLCSEEYIEIIINSLSKEKQIDIISG